MSDLAVTDPIIVALAITLTWLLRLLAQRLRPGQRTWLHRSAPLLAISLAAGLQAAWDAMATEQGMSWASVGRGVLAGCAAVAAHAQFRAVIKTAAQESNLVPGPELEERSGDDPS